MVLGLTTTHVANAQDRIYLGTRVPQMSTLDRSNIGAESNILNARGQMIFNTDSAMLQYWNGNLWVPVKTMEPATLVKQVTIAVEDGTFDTEHLIFYGTTAATTKPLKVLSIEPVFSDLAMRRNFLKVECAVQVVSGNTAEWSVIIENRNISPTNTCTLQSIVISYICDDVAELSNATQSITQIVGY